MQPALCYSPLSPLCRKVRMAMEFKQLVFGIIDGPAAQHGRHSPRDVPVLLHGGTSICNSADILAYLDRCWPEQPLYPTDAVGYAEARRWEHWADTQLEPIVTVLAACQATLVPLPPALLAAARRDLDFACDELQLRLAQRDFLCDSVGAADFAAYPQLAAAGDLGLPADPLRHPDLRRWLAVMRARPEGRSDAAAVRAGQVPPVAQGQPLHWGPGGVEWLLANGSGSWLVEQARAGRIHWSVGAVTPPCGGPTVA